jgi:hypothetical protein
VSFTPDLGRDPSVLKRAIAVAGDLAALPADALRHTRRQVRGPALDRVAHGCATDDLVLRMWDSPAAREKIDEYVKATLRR